MVDSEAYDRKLKPIYDAVDARNYKAAIKACEAAFKKYKNDQLVRALKAFALVKSGKRGEAVQLLEGLVEEGPSSERVLNIMTFAYKVADCGAAAITAAYAAAADKRPKDLELLVGLFGCYVREGNYIKQQQVASKLAKLAPGAAAAAGERRGDRYAWWVVCSLALQARSALLGQQQQQQAGTSAEGGGGSSSGGGLAGKKLLQLAQSMAARQVDRAGGQLSFEALLLHLDILQGQGNPTAALEVLEGAVGEAAVPLPADRQQLRAAAAVRAGATAEAAACYKQALLQNPDDWQSWQLHLDCLLPSTAEKGGVVMAAPSGSRFPVRVVGGLADLQDRWQQRHGEQQQQQGEQVTRAVSVNAAASATATAAAVAEAEGTLRELQAAVQTNEAWSKQALSGSLRAPMLAPLELLLRRVRLAAGQDAEGRQQQQQLLERLAAGVAQAYQQLGHIFSCAPDLRPYLAVIATSSPQQAAWLATEVRRMGAEVARSCCSSSAESAPTAVGAPSEAAGAPSSDKGQEAAGGSSGQGQGQVQTLQQVVNAYLLEHELGLPAFSSPAEAEAYAAELLDLYEQHVPLSEALDEKERGYGEELVSMAVAALLQTRCTTSSCSTCCGTCGTDLAAAGSGQLEQQQQYANASGSQATSISPGRRLVQALLVLEAAQVRRRVSAPFRLACTALYGLLSAPQLAVQHFSALDIKHILHDSMTGHWLLAPLLGAGAEGALLQCLSGIAGLHDEHQRDAGDLIFQAYEHGTYSKVLEFVDFKERLLHSHTRLLAKAEAAALQLRAAAADAGGLHDAAAKAVARLADDALAPLLSSQPQQQAGGGEETPGSLLRFDEDLATRPAWFPPHLAAVRTGTADWWEAPAGGAGRQQQQQGYAACWWSEVAAAESRSNPATAWRLGQLAALRRRWLLPAVLAAALTLQPTAADMLLLEQCSQQWEASSSAAAAAAAAEPAGAAGQMLDSLQAALASAAQAVQGVVAASGSQQAGQVSADSALERLAALEQRWQVACAQAAAGLAATASQLPGLPLPANHSAALVASLLGEEAAWAAACLQGWSRGPLRSASSVSSTTQAPVTTDAAAQILAGVRHTAAALKTGVQAVVAALDHLAEPSAEQQIKQAAAALDLFAMPSGGDDTSRQQPLWAFEQQFKPLQVLKRLVAEQRETVQRLQAAGQATLQVLGSAA